MKLTLIHPRLWQPWLGRLINLREAPVVLPGQVLVVSLSVRPELRPGRLGRREPGWLRWGVGRVRQGRGWVVLGSLRRQPRTIGNPGGLAVPVRVPLPVPCLASGCWWPVLLGCGVKLLAIRSVRNPRGLGRVRLVRIRWVERGAGPKLGKGKPGHPYDDEDRGGDRCNYAGT